MWRFLCVAAVCGGLTAGLTSCQSFPESNFPPECSQPPPTPPLMAGDEVQITFLDASELNTTQVVGQNGNISLKLVGEIKAAGKTPQALRKEVIDKYASQLQVKEVDVAVKNAQPAFVTGAVLTPGRVDLGHPLTVLEAIAEAGGFDEEWAEVRRVMVVRNEEGMHKVFTLNFGGLLSGRQTSTAVFYLRPFDVVYVPRLSNPRSGGWGTTSSRPAGTPPVPPASMSR